MTSRPRHEWNWQFSGRIEAAAPSRKCNMRTSQCDAAMKAVMWTNIQCLLWCLMQCLQWWSQLLLNRGFTLHSVVFWANTYWRKLRSTNPAVYFWQSRILWVSLSWHTWLLTHALSRTLCCFDVCAVRVYNIAPAAQTKTLILKMQWQIWFNQQ